MKINQTKRNQEYLLGRAWVWVRVGVRWVGVTLVQCGPVGYPAPVHEQDAVQEVFQKHFSNWFRADRATSRWIGTYGTVRCGVVWRSSWLGNRSNYCSNITTRHDIPSFHHIIWCPYLWMIHRARLGGRPAGIDSPSYTTKKMGMIESEREKSVDDSERERMIESMRCSKRLDTHLPRHWQRARKEPEKEDPTIIKDWRD